MRKKVIILGAGVAGLACALTLKNRGIESLIIEKESRAGGRIKTERNDEGFLFDRGFQVLLNSYPELPNFLDLKQLDLRNFSSGALIYTQSGNQLLANPLKHPTLAFHSLFSRLATPVDKLRILRLFTVALQHAHVSALKGQTTLEYLIDFGFSEVFIRNFWKPFLTGVYLDQTLSLDANFFLFLLRSFSLGSVSLPAKGMEEIPKQMFKNLNPKSVIFSTHATEIYPDRVKLSNGETLVADFVIKAHAPQSMSDRSVSTFYFAASQKPNWQKWLLLIPPGSGFRLNSLTLLSEVSNHYAPRGQHLISASVVGNHDPLSSKQIQEEVTQISGRNLGLHHLHTETIDHALPYLSPPEDFSVRNGIYECGDHVSTPSLNGALRSGRTLGEFIATEVNRGSRA